MFTKSHILFSVFVIAVSPLSAGGGPSKDDEEYTGKPARPGQFPFAVRLYSVVKNTVVTYCTASIITYSKLLTAGHCCITDADRFVVSGDPDHTDYVNKKYDPKHNIEKVKKVILHPYYERTKEKLVNDLCLLFLEKPLDPKKGHKTIEISYDVFPDLKNCTALGWGSNVGYTIQHRLYYKKAIAYRCNLRFAKSSDYWFVCLEPHSVCPGDSGGPLVCNGKLYGVASFFIGHRDDPSPKCEEGVIDYYSELSAEVKFLEQSSSERNCHPYFMSFVPFLLSIIYFQS